MKPSQVSQPASQSHKTRSICIHFTTMIAGTSNVCQDGVRACVRACVQACLAPALPLLLLLLLLLLLPARLTCSQHHAVGLSQVVCFVVAW
jgi:hypothetical protein